MEFIEALDANDNGISAYPSDVKPSFALSGITLPSMVGDLNPNWNQPIDQEREDEMFLTASKLMGEVFVSKLNYYVSAWLPARDYVVTALAKRFDHHPSGQILVFERSIPWKDHLFMLEKEQGITGNDNKPLYVLYGEGNRPGWRIQCVPVSTDSFENRKGLPVQWRGTRDDELSKISGISGGVFVHASGFIGGNKTFEGALEMAKKSLAM